MWFFGREKSSSGFSSSSTAEEVTHGIDGTGLTAIVTGASSGLGAETTRVLALRGVHVIMAIRNIGGGKNIKDKILEEIPSAKIDIMELDLSSMSSVRKFVSDYKSTDYPLNLLINNAGVNGPPFTLSKDNVIEIEFATNYLGHFLLTHLLLETMKNTALKCGKEGRIVNVSSEAHRYTTRGGIRFDRLNNNSSRYYYCGFFAYCRSKLANNLHANELARHLKNDKVQITINSIHPGIIYTNIFRHNSFSDRIFRIRILTKFILKDVHQGASTTCYVALHPEMEGVSGKYLCDCKLVEPSKLAQDTIFARKLWDFTMDLINSN